MQLIQELLSRAKRGDRLSPSISQITYGELPILVIDHPLCQAAIALQGAHLLFWQPAHTTSPVIWLSEQAQFVAGKAIRGGVPICWPWFNKLGGQPSHGFARISEWQRMSYFEDENGVELVLQLKDSEATRQIWDYAFTLQLVIKLSSTCQLLLQSFGDFTATGALHSYFGVEQIGDVRLSGLGETYQESLATENPPQIAGQLRIDQPVDRIYTHAEASSLLEEPQRKINITHIGATDVVVWNPWQQGAQAMTDMADDGYQTMLCVESARITQPMLNKQDASNQLGVLIEVIDNSAVNN